MFLFVVEFVVECFVLCLVECSGRGGERGGVEGEKRTREKERENEPNSKKREERAAGLALRRGLCPLSPSLSLKRSTHKQDQVSKQGKTGRKGAMER